MLERLKRFFGWGRSCGLTREAIAALPPGKLCRKVLYSLPDAQDANEAQWDFVYLTELDGEVRNGGFNQYYYNSGEHGRKAERAFVRMGADDLAELVAKANDCFEKNRERLEKHWDGTLKGFSASYKEHLFDRFDSEYYALTGGGRFPGLLAEYVRSRADDFIQET